MKTTKNKMVTLSEKAKDRIFICCMLIFPIIQFIVFWLIINGRSIALAFESELTGELSLDNFRRFFRTFTSDWQNDRGIKLCIQNTCITAGISMFIASPLVWFASYVLFKKYFGHMFFRIVFYIPGIVGTVISATMMSYILDATGPIVIIGKMLGIKWNPQVLQSGLIGNNLTARPTFFLTSVTISGSTVLLLTGAMQKIPQDLFDVGKIEGVGMFREFGNLVFPCCWSTMGIMWIMTFAQVWGDYSRVMLLTGGAYRTNNFGYYLFASSLAATQGTENYNYPAAIGILLTCLVVPLTLLLRFVANKAVDKVEF